MRTGICAQSKMATPSRAMLLCGNVVSLAARVAFNRSCGLRHVPTTSLLPPEQLAFRTYCTEVNQEEPKEPDAREVDSLYKEMPWKYLESEGETGKREDPCLVQNMARDAANPVFLKLTLYDMWTSTPRMLAGEFWELKSTYRKVSEFEKHCANQKTAEVEYITKYGNNPVWFGYRRNFKGQVPPQKTRKMCIRRGHVCGNPCPICRDRHLFLDYRNVKLLEQFMCPHSNIILDPSHTGLCIKKYNELAKAIDQAQDTGLLPVSTPFISFRNMDWSNQHPAVSKTPPSPALCSKTSWYPWYDWQQPSEKKIKLFRKIYKDYLKEESNLS